MISVRLAVLGSLALAARLAQVALRDGEDLAVYHRAVHAWAHGASPYALDPALFGSGPGFVFKYPPWSLPLLSPLLLLTAEQTRALWLVITLACMAYAVSWLRKQGASLTASLWAMLLLTWIWVGHASAGQVSVLVLAATLAMAPRGAPEPRSAAPRMALGTLALALKVFSLATLGGALRAFRSPRTWLCLGGSLLALHAAYALVLWAGGGDASLVMAYREWIAAAGSGGAALGAEAVRGPGSHGLTALVLRMLDPEARQVALDAWIALALALALGLTWWRVSRGLRPAEIWAGWIALGVVVHPVAWHHSFVLTYPLGALALDHGLRARASSRAPLALAILGLVFVGLLIPQTLGSAWVRPLELAGIKSWGVILLALSLLTPRQTSREAQAS